LESRPLLQERQPAIRAEAVMGERIPVRPEILETFRPGGRPAGKGRAIPTGPRFSLGPPIVSCTAPVVTA
jgi:hypothetical protein